MSADLQIDRQQLSQSFGRAPLQVSHTLIEHDLLTKDSLAELAEAAVSRGPCGRARRLAQLVPDETGSPRRWAGLFR